MSCGAMSDVGGRVFADLYSEVQCITGNGHIGNAPPRPRQNDREKTLSSRNLV